MRSPASTSAAGWASRTARARTRPVALHEYAERSRETFAGFDGALVLEPGRYLVAEAGVLLTRVIRVKHGADRRFLVVDAAMNDLLRPSLYDAWHEIVPVHDRPDASARYDVVGPVCETGDTFAIARALPRCEAGRPVDDRRRGRLRCVDGFDLQFAAADRRSAGRRRMLCGDPAPSDASRK